MEKLLAFCAALNQRRVVYDVKSVRTDSVMVCVVTPGAYWEIEFFADGSLEVERFVSQGVTSARESDLDHILEMLQ